MSREYVAAFDRTAAMAPAERVAAFTVGIVPLFPAFYSNDRDSTQTMERYDARVARSMDRFPAIRAAFEANLADAVCARLDSSSDEDSAAISV